MLLKVRGAKCSTEMFPPSRSNLNPSHITFSCLNMLLNFSVSQSLCFRNGVNFIQLTQTVGLTACSSLLSECCTKLRLLLDLIILQKQSRGREIGAPSSSHPHAALLLCGSAYGAPPSPVLVLLIGAS